jgi:8-oxo-dGTP pyrophosphatase MutT (NUDIX family)
MSQSYKIFIKDKPLFILSESAEAPLEAYQLKQEEIANFTSFLDKLPENTFPAFLILTDDLKRSIQQLKDQLKLIRAAGGIVWNQQKELLMIFRRGRWDLPKGKIENDESTNTAALREVEEECGVGKLRLLHPFATSYHIYCEQNEWILKETFWYEMTSSDTGPTKPQHSEGITHAEWVPLHKVPEKFTLAYASVTDLLERAMERGYVIR